MSSSELYSRQKLFKYRLLRRLPGKYGQRCFDRYAAETAMQSMPKALEKCRGMNCIDLGANVGEFTAMMAAKAGKVFAFEPDPWSYGKLVVRVGDFDNVETIKAAAGLEDGEISLYRHEAFDENPLINSQSSSVCASKNNIDPSSSCIVKQIDFLEFLRDLDTEVGILKIDIEGAEIELLEALFADKPLFKRIRYVFAETHEKRIPEHRERVKNLRKLAQKTLRPEVNLYWH